MIGHFLVIVCVLIIEQGFPYALQSPFMYTLLLECTSVHLAKGSLCIYRVFVGILSNFNLDLKTSYVFQCIKNVFDCFVKVPSFTTLYFSTEYLSYLYLKLRFLFFLFLSYSQACSRVLNFHLFLGLNFLLQKPLPEKNSWMEFILFQCKIDVLQYVKQISVILGLKNY